MRSPVLVMVYKRPDTVRQILEVLRQVKPPKLYISANAPHPGKNEQLLVEETRAVFDGVDWPCEIVKHFRTEHIPLAGMSLYYGIDWFFKNEEEGIILEDDVLPHPDFFSYCDELLERYRDDDDIFSISGRNCFYDEQPESPFSYYFTNFTAIWGWAGWRRSWNLYRFSIDYFDRESFINKLHSLRLPQSCYRYYLNLYDQMKTGDVDTEDFQFLLTQWYYNKKSILPVHNLNKNIGFGRGDAVHKQVSKDKAALYGNQGIMPLIHPHSTTISSELEKEYLRQGNVQLASFDYYKIKIVHAIKYALKKCLSLFI